LGTCKRVNGRLRGPVYDLTRTVAVPSQVEPTSLTVRGRNRIYGLYFRENTGRVDALALDLLAFAHPTDYEYPASSLRIGLIGVIHSTSAQLRHPSSSQLPPAPSPTRRRAPSSSASHVPPAPLVVSPRAFRLQTQHDSCLPASLPPPVHLNDCLPRE
jgi:hypothetical protein